MAATVTGTIHATDGSLLTGTVRFEPTPGSARMTGDAVVTAAGLDVAVVAGALEAVLEAGYYYVALPDTRRFRINVPSSGTVDIETIVVSGVPSITPAEVGMPAGGADGQVLTKQSATDFDADWETPGSGSGDVVGPPSAVDNRLAAFDGTTGKLIKDSGATTASFAAASHTHASDDISDGTGIGRALLTAADAASARTTIGTDAAGTARPPTSHTHPQSESHGTPDTDAAPTSLHHTLGTGANQAAAGDHTHAQLHDAATVADSDTVDLTLTGQQIGAAARLQMSLTSDASGIKLSGDSATPGASKVYGTDGSGVKGWQSGGTGDVVGPASATADGIPLFSGTTGKLIKDGLIGLTALSKTADVQVFTSSGTWTKPTAAKVVIALVVGGGGGGGAGARRLSTTASSGGGGGGGGSVTLGIFPAGMCGGSESVSVGAGGGGAAAQGSDNTDGASGTSGGGSSFGALLPSVSVGSGGTGGRAGAAATGGNGGTGAWAGSGGGTGANGAAGASGSVANYGAAGGGAGGGIDATPAFKAGGQSGYCYGWHSTRNAAGTSDGASAPAASNDVIAGRGGGGGASSVLGVGGNGASGGTYGGGGGGGGSSLNGYNSGAGGNGAGGIVIVYTLF